MFTDHHSELAEQQPENGLAGAWRISTLASKVGTAQRAVPTLESGAVSRYALGACPNAAAGRLGPLARGAVDDQQHQPLLTSNLVRVSVVGCHVIPSTNLKAPEG
jgi:hypothetical protein